MSVIPAIIPHTCAEVEERIALLQGTAPAIQIDIVDGVFVPFRSWPYDGEGNRQSLAPLAQLAHSYELEFDLMVKNPETFIKECADIGARRVIFHVESTDRVADCIRDGKAADLIVGLSLNNDSDPDVVRPFFQSIDFIQCMGIADIGTQGQPFDERVLARIRDIKTQFPLLPISVDGGVDEHTIALLTEAGATRLVVGSAIFNAPDPHAAYQTLLRIFESSPPQE